MRVCIVFNCHVLTAAVQATFRRLQNEVPRDHDVFFLFLNDEEPKGVAEDILNQVVRVAQEDMLQLGFSEKCRREGWSITGNMDLSFLEFFRRHPGYDQYWFVEYDVHWQGHWSIFFERFRNSKAGLIAATIQRIDQVPAKLRLLSIPELKIPPQFRWDAASNLKSFLPICRLSNSTLTALQRAYEGGLGGHYEITVPSIAAQESLEVEDIGGNGIFVRPENRNRFYFASGSTYTHSPGSFVFRPGPKVLDRENTLWHPVKPPGVPVWHPMRLTGRLHKTLLEIMKPIGWQFIIRLWFATLWRPLRTGHANLTIAHATMSAPENPVKTFAE